MPLFDSLEELEKNQRRIGRRRFLIASAAGIAAFYGYRWWKFRPQPPAGRKTGFITANRDFYDISIQPSFRPRIEESLWRLTLQGPAGQSRDLSYAQLQSLKQLKIYKTFMCISNPVGGTAIGNALWTVTPLAPLLESLVEGPWTDRSVLFYAQDGFHSSVPAEVALDSEAFLAYEMNGERLPDRHGYPLRVLLPGKYGMKQPRWLERIEISDSYWVSGYWEKRGWSYDCNVKSFSRFDAAIPGGEGSWLITGIAYCGEQPVGSVEVSVDDEASWQVAALSSQSLPNAWSTWEFRWRPPAPGRHALSVRVIDGAGNGQLESYSGSFPSGSSGLHRIVLDV